MIDEIFFQHVKDEVERAKKIHPSNRHRFASLMEEQGEFNQAWLNHEEGKVTYDEIYLEAVQSVAMTIRLLTEGDSNFNFKPITIYDMIE